MVSWILMFAITAKGRPPVMEMMSTTQVVSKQDCIDKALPHWYEYYKGDVKLTDLHTFCLEVHPKHPKKNMIWNVMCAPAGNCQVI